MMDGVTKSLGPSSSMPPTKYVSFLARCHSRCASSPPPLRSSPRNLLSRGECLPLTRTIQYLEVHQAPRGSSPFSQPHRDLCPRQRLPETDSGGRTQRYIPQHPDPYRADGCFDRPIFVEYTGSTGVLTKSHQEERKGAAGAVGKWICRIRPRYRWLKVSFLRRRWDWGYHVSRVGRLRSIFNP